MGVGVGGGVMVAGTSGVGVGSGVDVGVASGGGEIGVDVVPGDTVGVAGRAGVGVGVDVDGVMVAHGFGVVVRSDDLPPLCPVSPSLGGGGVDMLTFAFDEMGVGVGVGGNGVVSVGLGCTTAVTVGVLGHSAIG